MERIIKKELPFGDLTVRIMRFEDSCHLLFYGGERPHVGCTVLAIPRPSLTGDGKISSTSSVLNVTGHKDETICRYLAEKVAAAWNIITVCSGGFHVDGLEKAQIDEVLAAVMEIAKELE